MKKISMSYAVICLNEERTIVRCLKAIKSNMGENDEIIVVDTGSTDNTIPLISSKFPTVKLYNFKWNNSFASARNYCIEAAKKDWIFFVDADETLYKKSGLKVKNNILRVSKIAPKPFVMVPKIINKNGSIVYNAGRIIPNNSRFRFYGAIHEYPIIDSNKDGTGYDTIRLNDVMVYHDGYDFEVMKSKHKSLRNSELDKIMLKKMPNSIRYNFLYFRDAKSIIGDKKYVEGMTQTFLMDKRNKFSQEAGLSLLLYYVNEKNFVMADKYIEKLAELINEPNSAISKWELIYLASVNELNKLNSKEFSLLKTLIAVRNNHSEEINEYFREGFNYDELIGLILLSLGQIKEANELSQYLNKNGFKNQLTSRINKFKEILGSNNEKK